MTVSVATPTSAPPSSPSVLQRAPAGLTVRDRGKIKDKDILKSLTNTIDRKATGECVGWQCLCKSTEDATLPPEFEDIKASE